VGLSGFCASVTPHRLSKFFIARRGRGTQGSDVCKACMVMLCQLVLLLPLQASQSSQFKAGRAGGPATNPHPVLCCVLPWCVMFDVFLSLSVCLSVCVTGGVKAREWVVLLSVLAKQGITPPAHWQRATHAVMQVRRDRGQGGAAGARGARGRVRGGGGGC